VNIPKIQKNNKKKISKVTLFLNKTKYFAKKKIINTFYQATIRNSNK